MLYHVAQDSVWQRHRANNTGVYLPDEFAREGFIHCSYRHQVLATANRLFRGRHDLVLLTIDPGRLPSELRLVDENLEGGSELFPHLYGPLPLAAVSRADAWISEDDGGFSRLP